MLVIYKVFPSNVKVVAGIFEANMIVGSIVAIVLVVWFIRKTTTTTATSSQVLLPGDTCINGNESALNRNHLDKEVLNEKRD